MVEIYSSILSIIYTLKSLILYSLGLTVFLTFLYYPGKFLFSLFEKRFNFTFASLFSTYIMSLICVVIIYFVPYWFMGFELTGYSDSVNKFVAILYLIGMFLLYALIISFIAQLFVFFGTYLKSKFKFKSDFLKTLLTLFIISIVLIIILMIFPWIPGGILNMIIF